MADAITKYVPHEAIEISRSKVADAIEYAKVLTIDTPSDDAVADAVLTKVHETLKALDDLYDLAKAPAYDEYVRIRNLFDELRKPLAAAKEQIKSKRAGYLDSVEAAHREAQAQIANAINARDHDATITALTLAQPVAQAAVVAGRDLKKDWTFRITDPNKCTWMCPDVERIKALCKKLKATDLPPDLGEGVIFTLAARVSAKVERR
jgi:hypothetical protein